MADSLFTAGVDEPDADYSDGIANGIAVTVHFPLTAGTITHVRFRAPANVTAGVHQAAVWEITGPDTNPSGIRLTDVLTFESLQPAAWNLLEIPGGLPVARGGPGGKAYRVIVYSSLGRYTARGGYFAALGGKTSPGGYVHAPHSGDDPVGLGALAQGTYGYVPAGIYVADTFGAASYYVDVVFEPAATPPILTGVAAAITVTDAVAAAAAYTRTLAATTTLTGTTVPALALARGGSAALVLTDSVTAANATSGRTATEAVILGSAAGRSLSHARVAAGTLTLGGGARATVFRSAAAAETLTLSAAASRSGHMLARTAAVGHQLTAQAQASVPTPVPAVPHTHHVTMTVAVPGRITFTAGPGVTA
ncbi:DUF4082 domain-containing protein [Actinoplanes derwentensis]|uniref:DUF4082 domain-containing protein n=1 Tax=Actinoplanes derwentensis TaxID=113562 RepID=A0A1H2CUY2_9ACTN|nr:DUF4082 domain-containing protein [Actinoplanes derwentensis]GID82012.1 hypothetical protein Ade03nite_09360 [Actinoplanes derwentensis]SDT74360.1 hypothetical protein SAMN04489716_6958 [Actinoplanes derwentensis]